jgi:hypothetical protein
MNIQIAKAQLELIRIRQARKAVIQDDSQHWVTLNGAHVLIDGEGEVISGAGGKLNWFAAHSPSLCDSTRGG